MEVIQSPRPKDVADTRRDRLLPLVLVQRPGDLAFEEEPVDALLEAADQQHRSVQPRCELGRRCPGVKPFSSHDRNDHARPRAIG